MPSNPKPVRMWGWTYHDGTVACCYDKRDNWPADYAGGTRIRVVVTPAKKPAKCDCNRMGLVASPCGFAMDPCTNPKCKRSVQAAAKKPAKKRRAAK